MKTKLKTVNIKGKEYVEVNERVIYFRENFKDWALTTEILELDDMGKPLVLEPMDYGIQYFEDATSIYSDNEVVGSNNMLPPVVFGMGDNQAEDDMAELEMNGFTHLQ